MLSIHPVTHKQMDAFVRNMPHALLVTGPFGVGASALAQSVASQVAHTVTTVLPEKDESVDVEKGIISVGMIRNLYNQTRTKTNDRRVIIIDYAERMAAQAQNAFLKLLEEPTAGISFILVTHEPQKLLPTVRSRTQLLEVRPVTASQSANLLNNLGITDSTKRMQLVYMANGLPAELTRLASDQEYFDYGAAIVRDAREFLQADTYQKLLIANKYKDNRPDSLRLLEVAMNILQRTLTTHPHQALTEQLETLLTTYDAVNANGNIRLQLSRAVL